MAAKLVLAMIVLAIIVALVVAATFLYFKRRAELDHEKEMREMDQTEELFEDR